MLLKISELRDKTLVELKELLEQCNKSLLGLRFKRATGSLSDTSLLRKGRRGIAMIMTVLNEKMRNV